ncbi:MAG: two-component system sensor kinase FixL, partial [Pseudoalteromonas tetraodonis]
LEGFEELTEELINTARVVVLLLDASAKIVQFNAFMEQISGYKTSEVAGKDWFDTFILPEDETATRAVFDRSIGGDSVIGHINPIVAKDGTLKEIEWFERTLVDADGKVQGLLVVGRDITEQLSTESKLRDSEERASAVLETAVNAIVTMDETRIICSVNSATEKMFGYRAEEMIGQNVKILMPPPYREAHDGYVENYVSGGEKKIIGIGREIVARRRDGSTFPADLSVGEAVLEDGSRLFTGILRDLTARKRLEERILEISEEEQRRIGRDIHDDLCQQLAGIGCLAQVLQKQLTDDGNQAADGLAEVVQMVSEANARAREMSRGLVPVIRESDGLATALSEIASRTTRLFGIKCTFSTPRPVFLDDNKFATQLFRVAQEAVSNACRHSGGDRIDITLERKSGELFLKVRDNGKGLPAAGAERTEGLGLLTMDHRAKMLGGQLNFALPQGGGTEVVCRVPDHHEKRKEP